MSRAQTSLLLTFALAGDDTHPAASVHVQVHRREGGAPRVVAASLRLSAAADVADAVVSLGDGQVVVDVDPGNVVGGMEILTRDDQALAGAMAEVAGKFADADAKLVRDACSTLRYLWGVSEHLLKAGLLDRQPAAPGAPGVVAETAATQSGEWMPALAGA